ncbi:MAG: polysaccharide biosynthesis protein [Lachnospiraceae bacterium]|nr:polysaccharide biosynthesis protein [Lachnospiraceae bacterium]
MAESLKKSIFKGTLILTIAGIGARILGFYNRIFLNQLIGERELGLYQMVLPLYMVMFGFACQGIQTALTRQIARIPEEDYKKKHMLLHLALMISVPTAVLMSIVLYREAGGISLHILHSIECARSLRILAFAFPFVCIEGCMTGYFIGESDTGITAISQMIEQVAKILGVYLIAAYGIQSKHQAYIAVYGIVIGEVAASALLCLHYRIHFYKLSHIRGTKQSFRNQRSIRFTLFKELIKDGIPLTANRLSLTLLQSLESILIPHMLNLFYQNGDSALILYGTLSGLVLPCIMFPTTFTNSLSLTLLPAISAQYESHNHKVLKRLIKKSLILCLGIGLISTVYLLFFGKWTGKVILSSDTAGELLFRFALLCPWIYLSSTLASILNGIGKAAVNMLHTILCSGIRIGFILLLVPHIGLKGYMWGMLAGYLIQTTMMAVTIYHSLSLSSGLDPDSISITGSDSDSIPDSVVSS